MPRSGNFADVYEMTHPNGKKWAVKCFTRQVAGLRERYAAISAYLKQADLPFMVDFSYLEQGIQVQGQWYPILKMDWVEGFTLNEFVKRTRRQSAVCWKRSAQIWVKLARRLREAKLAHCDLQHGNVLLVPGKRDGGLSVKLIDYDGMWVPALAGQKSGEVGHPAYQHPQRLRDGTYNAEVDRFPHLVICTALRGLMVGRPLLVEQVRQRRQPAVQAGGPGGAGAIAAGARDAAGQRCRAAPAGGPAEPGGPQAAGADAVARRAWSVPPRCPRAHPRPERRRRSRRPAWAAGLLVLALMGLVVGGIKYGLPLLKKDTRVAVAVAPTSPGKAPKDAGACSAGAASPTASPSPNPRNPNPSRKNPSPNPRPLCASRRWKKSAWKRVRVRPSRFK